MITFCAARGTLLALSLALLAGCGRELEDWHSAETVGSAEAYSRFLEQHPDSELAAQARTRIGELAEDGDWNHTESVATVDAYRQFLARHPRGKWAEQARIRIEGFSLGSLPRTLAGPATASAARTGANALSLTTGVAAVPAGVPAPAALAQAPPAQTPAAVADADAAQPAPPADETRMARATPVGYGVQLGAFGSEASAGREWVRLQERFAPELSGLAPRIIVASTDAGTLYRLQAPAGGEAQARALCNTLKEQSQACVPVIPR